MSPTRTRNKVTMSLLITVFDKPDYRAYTSKQQQGMRKIKKWRKTKKMEKIFIDFIGK